MQISRAPKRSSVLFLAGGFVFLFGLVFGLVGRSMVRTEHQYAADGAKAVGTVISKRIEQRHERGNKNSVSTYYYVKYSFTPEGFGAIEAESSASYELYEQLSASSPIEIQYIRSNPETNRPADAGMMGSTGGYVFMAIGLLVGAVGAGIILYEIRQRMLGRRLARDGMLVDAEILDVGPGSVSINGVKQWQIEYRFRDMHGQEITGRSGHLPPHTAKKWEGSATCKVRYDKANSKLNIWVES